MGYTSQAGHVILATQSGKGVAATPSAGVAMRLRSGSLAPNRELLIPDPEIGGGRDIADAYLGTVSFSGDYEAYARLESIATLLAAALGARVTTNDTPAAGANEHVITPSDGALPYLSVQEKIGDGLDAYDYLNAVVNSFHLEAEPNGYLMCTAGMIAERQTAQAAPEANPSWDNSPLIVGTNITVEYAGVVLPAKSFSLDINNNFEDDDFRLGSFFLGDLTPKRREITASVSLRHEDKATFRQATYGTAAATAPGGLTTKDVLKITCETYENIGATSIKGTLEIELPKVIFAPFAFAPSGDDILENDIEMQAVRPDNAVDIMTATIYNGATAIA